MSWYCPDCGKFNEHVMNRTCGCGRKVPKWMIPQLQEPWGDEDRSPVNPSEMFVHDESFEEQAKGPAIFFVIQLYLGTMFGLGCVAFAVYMFGGMRLGLVLGLCVILLFVGGVFLLKKYIKDIVNVFEEDRDQLSALFGRKNKD